MARNGKKSGYELHLYDAQREALKKGAVVRPVYPGGPKVGNTWPQMRWLLETVRLERTDEDEKMRTTDRFEMLLLILVFVLVAAGIVTVF